LSRSVLIALFLVPLIAGPASANLYQCERKDGRTFITNTPNEYRAAGAKCWLVMNTPSGASVGSDEGEKVKRSKRSKRKRSSYKPRAKHKSSARALSEPNNTAERYALYEPYVREAADKYRLPEAFVKAVMRVESSFRYKAVSSAGAQGLMQLMPGTAREMGVHDSFDPRQNIMGGSKLLRLLANRFDGDFAKVLSAYHAGSGAVRAKGGIPFEATEGYVKAVMDRYYTYKGEATP